MAKFVHLWLGLGMCLVRISEIRVASKAVQSAPIIMNPIPMPRAVKASETAIGSNVPAEVTDGSIRLQRSPKPIFELLGLDLKSHHHHHHDHYHPYGQGHGHYGPGGSGGGGSYAGAQASSFSGNSGYGGSGGNAAAASNSFSFNTPFGGISASQANSFSNSFGNGGAEWRWRK